MPSHSKIICKGAACTDCLMLLANGETPPELSEAEAAEYLARVDKCCEGTDVTLGMLRSEHSCQTHTCQDEDGYPADECECETADECECEQLGFSWSACDVCGSNLGGDRYGVTFWTKEN